MCANASSHPTEYTTDMSIYKEAQWREKDQDLQLSLNFVLFEPENKRTKNPTSHTDY